MAYKDPEQAKAYAKAYWEKNRAKESARIKAWKQENKERTKNTSKDYNELNKEKIKEQKRQYYLENKEKINARNIAYNQKNKEARSKKEAEWRQKNKGRVAANIRKYQMSKRNRTPSWLTDFDHLKIQCIYQMAAMYTRVNNESWEVDHVIPLQGVNVSGLHVPLNLQIMRGVENIGKKNKYEVTHA